MPKDFKLADNTIVDPAGKRQINLLNCGLMTSHLTALLAAMPAEHIETLDLTRNNLTDTSVEHLTKFPVKRLILRNNNIRNAIALIKKDYDALDLTDNPLNDETLLYIIQLPKKAQQKIFFIMPDDPARCAKLKSAELKQDAAALARIGKFAAAPDGPTLTNTMDTLQSLPGIRAYPRTKE